MKKFVKISAMLAIGLALGTATSSLSSSVSDNQGIKIEASTLSQKKLKKLTKAINSDLQDEENLGNTTWSWNEDNESWEATLDANSELYQDMSNGGVSVWNSYVRQVKSASKEIKKAGWSDYSAFQIINPDDTTRVLLQVYDGKIKYDVGEDLQ